MSKFSKVIFYPVDNGNMILVKLNDERKTTILIDINIRNDENAYDVISHLKNQLEKNGDGRYIVDAFILTHLDVDHIRGLQQYFHLGNISDYADKENEKIIINETWSSERFWKRETESITLSDEAKAFNREMRRRAELSKTNAGTIQEEGNRAIILGEDDDGYNAIIYNIGCNTSKINNKVIQNFKLNILGPLEQQKNEENDSFEAKNRASVILQLEIIEGGYTHKILLTGDAEVDVWEYMYQSYDNEQLEYDILSVPHHCSWHSMSWDKDDADEPQVSENAINALSQAKEGALIISNSKKIKDDDINPPHFRAKNEYIKIVDKDNFLCTGEYRDDKNIEPIIIELTSKGWQLKSGSSIAKVAISSSASAKAAYPHGKK